MSNKRKPLGHGKDGRKNSNKKSITNYLFDEINCMPKRFKVANLGDLEIKKPFQKGKEWIFSTKLTTTSKEKIIFSGKSPCEYEAKRKLVDKLTSILKKKRVEDEKSRQEKVANSKIQTEAKLFLMTSDDSISNMLGHTYY